MRGTGKRLYFTAAKFVITRLSDGIDYCTFYPIDETRLIVSYGTHFLFYSLSHKYTVAIEKCSDGEC